MKSFIWTLFCTLVILLSVIMLVFLFPNWRFLPGRQQPMAQSAFQKCKQLARKERQSRINWNYLYYYENRDTKKNIIWCKVPKAGSTTLTRMFLRIAGARNLQNTTKIHRMLRTFYPRLTKGVMVRRLKSSFKFVVVRDPFERILSAYRDKLESSQRDLQLRDGYYYHNYGKHMVLSPTHNNNTVGREPTWQEFVKYLIKTPVNKFDEHWMPIHRLCSPCNVRFDAIVKMENFNDDIRLPLRKGGIYSPIGWFHQTGTSNINIIRNYFQNISIDDLNKLYKVYKRDFTLFGYSPLKYFRLANYADNKTASNML